MDIIQIHPYPARPRKKKRLESQRTHCDSFGVVKRKERFIRHQDVMSYRKNVSQSVLGREYRTKFFVTEESQKYLSQVALYEETFSRYRVDARKRVDSLHVRSIQKYSPHELLYMKIEASFASMRSQIFDLKRMRALHVSPVRMWQMSMACAMVFGMVTISMIYKNLGTGAQASNDGSVHAFDVDPVVASVNASGEEFKRLPTADKIFSEEELVSQKQEQKEKLAQELAEAARVQKIQEQEQKVALEEAKQTAAVLVDQERFEQKAQEMVAGYPIEKMLPEILKLDREVAIYMIAMAKQESQWGKRVPVLHNEDCYNYWGFRAKRERMGTGGHTCFDSREEAVTVVGKRVHDLIYEYKRTTPERMLVWKCGRSCDGHSPQGVKNWVTTVTMYRDALKS